MKTEITNLENIEKEISDLIMEIDTTQTSAYYTKFTDEADRQKDLGTARFKLRLAYAAKIQCLLDLAKAIPAEIEETESAKSFISVKFKEAS